VVVTHSSLTMYRNWHATRPFNWPTLILCPEILMMMKLRKSTKQLKHLKTCCEEHQQSFNDRLMFAVRLLFIMKMNRLDDMMARSANTFTEFTSLQNSVEDEVFLMLRQHTFISVRFLIFLHEYANMKPSFSDLQWMKGYHNKH
jgi:hypothetical protein